MKFNNDIFIEPQIYDKEPLTNIKIFDLTRHSDETGSFIELMRLHEGMFKDRFMANQINFSELAPLAIKAFHVHKTQTDMIFIPPSCKVKLVTADANVLGTEDNINITILGDMKSQLVMIPPGIAHGFQNLRSKPATIIYFVDHHFNPDHGSAAFQEYRINHDAFGEEIWDEPTQ